MSLQEAYVPSEPAASQPAWDASETQFQGDGQAFQDADAPSKVCSPKPGQSRFTPSNSV